MSCRISRFKCLASTLVVVCLGGSGCGQDTEPPVDSAALQSYEFGGDFTLTNHFGNPFALQDHRGEVVVLFFGYTYCPDFCPITVSKLAKVSELLEARSESVLTLFVTVDPHRDTPDQLRAYLSHFDFEITGLTGSESRIQGVVSMYGSSSRRGEADAAGHYLMDHSSRTYLIDQQGKVRYLFSHEDTPEQMAVVIGKLL